MTVPTHPQTVTRGSLSCYLLRMNLIGLLLIAIGVLLLLPVRPIPVTPITTPSVHITKYDGGVALRFFVPEVFAELPLDVVTSLPVDLPRLRDDAAYRVAFIDHSVGRTDFHDWLLTQRGHELAIVVTSDQSPALSRIAHR